MDNNADQQQIRLGKLEKIRNLGTEPYPYSFKRSHTVPEIIKQSEQLMENEQTVTIAGRLLAVRGKGKASFGNIQAQHTRLQIYVRLDAVGETAFEMFKLCDIGDHLGISGTLMHTKTGELTLRASVVELLSKSIRPIPMPKVEEKDGERIVHDEVTDKELRYRQRYLDLILNPKVAAVFQKRTLIFNTIRDYLRKEGFLEVETPTLQAVYGGANATPFVTHHKALDQKFYLRISNELYLKRLIAGGFDAVFEFVKDFRNEGIDRTHNPEFSALEFYQAYVDYNEIMRHTENICELCAIAVNGTTVIEYEGQTIDLTAPWPRLSMLDAIQTLGGISFEKMSDVEVKNLLKENGWELDADYNRGLATQLVFEETCETQLIQPTFITDHPKETSPLCKQNRENPELLERFEAYINGWEIANAYSELNDPVIQRRLMEEQVERGRGGEKETQPLDEDFLRAMEYGMPPMGGVGIGIDRIVMLFTGQSTIRDVILFPTMRPEA
ncbi:MAG: lysine--tRNA ligase [Deltaproteobacteria bacterium]|jgi:lysyl-tRNA synthetase class 2|nr:lysine--tRNA ligase [Deltaproteobacteria bacterium]MBT5793333.1 lysine--tRNA ligase [Deltaproteobacteria bacterium]